MRTRAWRNGQITTVLGWAVFALLAYLVYRVIAPLLQPLAWAAVFSIVVSPLCARLEQRWGGSPAALLSTLAVALVLVVPAVFIAIVFAGEAANASSALRGAMTAGRLAEIAAHAAELARRVPGAGVDVVDLANTVAEFLVRQSGVVLRDIALFSVDVVIALVATFFLLRDRRPIMGTLRRVLPGPEPMREALMVSIADLVAVGVTAAVAVAVVQGLLGAAAFWGLGIPAPTFWGVIMGLLCLLPFGAWLVWLPAALLLALAGDPTRALILAGLGVGVISGIDNVLRPALVSGRSHMHGLVILFGLLGGTAAFGLLGLVVGPVILAVALTVLTAYADSKPDWRNAP